MPSTWRPLGVILLSLVSSTDLVLISGLPAPANRVQITVIARRVDDTARWMKGIYKLMIE